LATSADGTTSIMAWSCTPGRFNWHYAVDETLHIISGEVFVTDADGESRRLGPGDVVFFPAGSRSLWHVTKEVRKLAFCRQSMPRPLGFALRAWNKLGNMLSSIFGLSVDDGDPLEGGIDRNQPPQARRLSRRISVHISMRWPRAAAASPDIDKVPAGP
jgi:hypothetical protein